MVRCFPKLAPAAALTEGVAQKVSGGPKLS